MKKIISRSFVGAFLIALAGLPALQASAATMPAGAISVKAKGAKADGVTNDLKAFQAAVAAVPKNGTVWVPAGKYLLDVSKKNNIAMKSNMTFAMDPNAVLMVKPNALTHYYVINTSQASNLEIYGGQLVGDRNQHKGTTGEWGFGIRISGGQHIKIHDMKISDMWGDGICTGEYPDDVVIQRILATNNRRQGLSITTGTNFQVLDSEFSYTNGTAPQYGIDIEPDNPDKGNYARHILIQGNYIHHNKAGGIQPYKNTQDIVIKDNKIVYNVYGIYTVGSLGGEISGNKIAHNIYQGIYFGGSTQGYKVDDNLFVNNSTRAVGNINPDSNPDEVLMGRSGKTDPHLQKSKSSTNIDVGLNTYRK
jgi:parallel beta-helix repeat protein